MYKKIFLMSSALCTTAFLIASQYNSHHDRNPDSQTSYGRLLSDAYRVILNHERQKGTFTNIDFFKAQSDSVMRLYNPRPLTTGEGQVQNIKKRQELRMQRFELERFMNGYAGRVAAQNVAMMHASYDCRVKNIETNQTMDTQCQQIFMQHKHQAEAKVNDYLGNPIPQIQQQPIPQPTVQQKPQESLMEIPQIPKNPMAHINPETENIQIKEQLPPSNNNTWLPEPKTAPPSQNTDTYKGNEKFNPLKSIHPSLQSNNPPKETFGIKPTSRMNISHNDTQQFDPIATATIKQPETPTQAMNIPFSSGLQMPIDGKRILGKVNQLLKQGNHNTITIIGHADKGNHDAIDVLMSEKRAKHIKAMLQHANPNIDIKITAAGSSQPIKGTTATDNRNRRVDILFN